MSKNPFRGRGLRAEHFEIETNYIIKDFLVERAITLIVAPPKKGKSLFAMGLCKYLIDHAKLNLQYFDFDNPLSAISDRGVDKIIKYYVNGLDYIHPEEVAITSTEALNLLVKNAEPNSYKNYVMIFDSIADFADVMSDSSSSAFMNKMKILRNAGATIILLHHSNKNESNYKGSSVFRSACDNMFSLESEVVNSIESNFMLNVESGRFQVRNSAFNLLIDDFTLKLLNYDDVCMPHHVREFIREVKIALKKAKEPLNQTKLLEAIGKDKRDKTSAELLTEYTGRYWKLKETGKSKLYSLI
jgi:RecA-family ATPase